MEIVEYEARFEDAVKDLLVSLQAYLVEIDPEKIQALPGGYREGYFRLTMDSIAAQDGCLLLAIRHGKAIGLIAGVMETKDDADRLTNRCPKRGRITELVVKPSARGTGAGKALMREMEARLQRMGCAYIAIDVFGPNRNALEFYRRNGYEPRNIEVMKPLTQTINTGSENETMTEREKAAAGYLFDPGADPQNAKDITRCIDLCHAYNQCIPSDLGAKQQILEQIIGSMGKNVVITAPFWCDHGYNISIGDDFYSNHNLVITDGASVTFGDHVFIAPNCCFTTAEHAIDAEQRNQGLEVARPIKVGNNVWIGAGTTVLAGVTIGENTVIGAGSVVKKDIPSNVVAVGVPCKVLREITQADKERYPR